MSRPARRPTAAPPLLTLLGSVVALSAAALAPIALTGCSAEDPAADDVVNEEGERVTDPGFAPEDAR